MKGQGTETIRSSSLPIRCGRKSRLRSFESPVAEKWNCSSVVPSYITLRVRTTNFPDRANSVTGHNKFAAGNIVGANCHGTITLANVPERIEERQVTGYSLAVDEAVERQLSKNFLLHYPQSTLEQAGAVFTCAPVGVWTKAIPAERSMPWLNRATVTCG
jgi:hypothetical protein